MKTTWLEQAACILHSLSMSILKKAPIETTNFNYIVSPISLDMQYTSLWKILHINKSKYGTPQHKPTP
jgi:hypothetical protein